ncbi:hypothetical protein [Streptomyces pinistramenti]|uniref:hypothetical protein n=1 Tax=Streptomyces pinistramenti TaxID=2884812 RepID=UPI001D091C99|nr:hypothetical protein [Streptomyces pinistramenti]MCB5911502.1 hypothetical protein [Streptomyces pinistramenti]
MSVLTARHIPLVGRPSAHKRGAVRATLAQVLHRLADSPLDSTVIRTVPAPAAARTPSARAERGPAPLHAHWHTVTGPDGRSHLEATWHQRLREHRIRKESVRPSLPGDFLADGMAPSPDPARPSGRNPLPAVPHRHPATAPDAPTTNVVNTPTRQETTWP